MKILLIEDDKETSKYVARGLKEVGHAVDIKKTGSAGALSHW